MRLRFRFRKETVMQITLDEGYQFGLGVFETIAVEQGTPLLLAWHLERLYSSMKTFGIQQSVTESDVFSWLSGQTAEHHALKIMASSENLLFTLRPNSYTPAQIQAGFRLAYSNVYRNETSPLIRHKTLNYGDCILEKRRAKALNVDELIFLNSRGNICEGTTTNIFFASGGKLYTPPVASGLLPGIMRRFILTHFPVTEQTLDREDALKMDECFVTNSLMGVMPVNALEQKEYARGPVSRFCLEVYRSACKVF